MHVKEAMSHDVQIANPEHTLSAVAKIMADHDIGLLPVGENDRLIGMISDRDIAVRAVANGMGPDTRVREAMSEDVKYCYDDESTDAVARKMAEQQLRRLPVLDRDKRLVGILSLADIATSEGPSISGTALEGISQPGGRHSQSGDGRSKGA